MASTGATLLRDRREDAMQVAFLDTERVQTLDGISSAVQSTVISATEANVVRLIPLSGAGGGFFKRGADPTAADNDGVYFDGETYTVIAAGEKVSIFGTSVNLCVVRREQE